MKNPPQKINLQEFQLGKKDDSPLYLGSMGIYVFKKSALINLLQEKGDDFGKISSLFRSKKGKNICLYL